MALGKVLIYCNNGCKLQVFIHPRIWLGLLLETSFLPFLPSMPSLAGFLKKKQFFYSCLLFVSCSFLLSLFFSFKKLYHENRGFDSLPFYYFIPPPPTRMRASLSSNDLRTLLRQMLARCIYRNIMAHQNVNAYKEKNTILKPAIKKSLNQFQKFISVKATVKSGFHPSKLK